MKYHNLKNHLGFTLVELMVILGILSMMIVASVDMFSLTTKLNAQGKAKAELDLNTADVGVYLASSDVCSASLKNTALGASVAGIKLTSSSTLLSIGQKTGDWKLEYLYLMNVLDPTELSTLSAEVQAKVTTSLDTNGFLYSVLRSVWKRYIGTVVAETRSNDQLVRVRLGESVQAPAAQIDGKTRAQVTAWADGWCMPSPMKVQLGLVSVAGTRWTWEKSPPSTGTLTASLYPLHCDVYSISRPVLECGEDLQ